MKRKKLIAWGASPVLELYFRNTPDHGFAYCIDKSETRQGKNVEGVPVYSPDKLKDEDHDRILIVITAMSSTSIQAIHQTLSELGYKIHRGYIDFAAFLKCNFQTRAESLFSTSFSEGNYTFARCFNMNSRISLETTVLGNWLLLESLVRTRHLKGSVAEVGAFKGGNAYLLLSAMSLLNDTRPYFIFDSFQGFGELSQNDPAHLQKAFDFDYKANTIFNDMALFDRAVVVPGFVPQTFSQIKKDERFSVVFYDCDLYQPALDTYAFFWDRIEPGGVLVIHDNIATKDGWGGVRKATSEFFGPKKIVFHDFWETTMSVIFK